MPLTTRGIWYPGKGELVSPFETNFAALASSIDDVLDSQFTPVKVNTIAEITSLKEGTPFYMTPWKLTGVKTAAVGVPGYQMNRTGRIIGVYNQNGYSGGQIIPGATEMAISSQSVPAQSTPFNIRYDVSIVLRITANCAGYIFLRSPLGASRDIRWHSYNTPGLYSVNGSVEFNAPIGSAQVYVSGNSDPLSQTPTEILTVSTVVTVSV